MEVTCQVPESSRSAFASDNGPDLVILAQGRLDRVVVEASQFHLARHAQLASLDDQVLRLCRRATGQLLPGLVQRGVRGLVRRHLELQPQRHGPAAMVGVAVGTGTMFLAERFNRSTLGESGAQTNGMIGLYTTSSLYHLGPWTERGRYIMSRFDVAMIQLFNGMQSSLSMVYDREMGNMRTLLVSPLPRWYLLSSKLVAGTAVSLLQVYAFLAIAWFWEVEPPPLKLLLRTLKTR